MAVSGILKVKGAEWGGMSSSVALSRISGVPLLLHMMALRGKSSGLWSFVSIREISKVPAVEIPSISTKEDRKP